ncbi:MAG: glycoside hydrolase family 95 protein [Capsulimonadaceae bacterium]|nr:glycoside hydrolase family 95 protein [Capsulimonadaceae bacterium]
MVNNNEIWLDKPAGNWNEAFPIGNGRLGAMIFGGIASERLQLNEDTLWSGEPMKPGDPAKCKALPAIQQLIFAGKYAEAAEECKKLQGPYTQSYLPLGDIKLTFRHEGDVSGYRRTLNIGDATAEVAYSAGSIQFTRTLVASAPDNAIVIRIAASKPGSISFTASLTSPLRSQTAPLSASRVRLTGRAPRHLEPNYSKREPASVYDDAPDGEGVRFCAILDAIVRGGSVSSTGEDLAIESADEVILTLTAATSFNGFDKSPGREGKDELALATGAADAVRSRSFDAVLRDHIADYRRYFDRVSVEFGTPSDTRALPTDKRLDRLRDGAEDIDLEALYFQFGRYLLISSSRPGTVAANLQGIWNEDTRPAWSSNFTININTQMNYWHSETTNLADLTGPLFDLIDALQVTGHDAARAYYNAGGWCAGHNADIWGLANPVGAGVGDPCWANWQMGGAWLVQHLWEHYEFGRDAEFLKKRAYPAIKGVAEFLLDALVAAPTGHLEICPSTSPENKFAYTAADGSQVICPVTTTTTMDRALIREVFGNTIKGARILGVDDDLVARIESVLPKLPPFEIGNEGQLREWPANLDEQDLGHRHISHLYAHHPASLITRTKTPELAAAVRTSLDRRIANGGGYTGWSRAWVINQYARLGEAEKAHDSIVALLAHSTYPSLLDVHPPFQIDGNFGGPAGMAEMLLQSHDGFIELLPALPSAWKSGKANGLRARGGVEVSQTWKDGKLSDAILSASVDGEVTVKYGAITTTLLLNRGQSATLDGKLARR